MNSSLKLFTQPDILQHIGIDSLQKFLNRFTDSNSELSSLNSSSPYYTSELARVFSQPHSLSAGLRETLLLLESAASPQNHDHLATLAQQRLPDLCVTEFHPLAIALELWLAFPDDLAQLCASSSSSSSSSSSGNTSFAECSSRREEAPSDCLPSIQPSEPCPTIQESTNPSIHPALVSPIENEDGRTSLVSKIENPDGGLLSGITSLVTRYVILPKHAAEALALWIVHSYAFELRDVTTYLALESPVRRCGKTTLLNILSRLVNRPLVAANVSPSALYRAIEELRPTLMIDEADTFLKPNDELIGILNAGYHRGTAYVLRVSSQPASKSSSSSSSNPNSETKTDSRGNDALSSDKSKIEIQNSKIDGGPDRVGPDHSLITNHKSRLVRFSCWCPKIIARIGRLPETLADRCIVVRMQRKTPNDQCERLRDLDVVAVGKDLRQQCAEFVEQHREAIATAKPAIPESLNDRAADIWEPLLAIADCAGGDWPQLAREAGVALSSDTRENNPIGSLLLDIFLLFAMSGQDRLPTRALIDALNTQFTERPWMETRKGQRSTEMWLSEQLRPFGISPRTLRNQNTLAKGYVREDFDEAFRRYIPTGELDALRAMAENATNPSH
jgi:hypothetical protein